MGAGRVTGSHSFYLTSRTWDFHTPGPPPVFPARARWLEGSPRQLEDPLDKAGAGAGEKESLANVSSPVKGKSGRIDGANGCRKNSMTPGIFLNMSFCSQSKRGGVGIK
jgi:hypothetical protein